MKKILLAAATSVALLTTPALAGEIQVAGFSGLKGSGAGEVVAVTASLNPFSSFLTIGNS
jgi:hypothetical protein